MMYPAVYRSDSSVSINFNDWLYHLLCNEGFNVDEFWAADDLIHMIGICGECFVF